MDTHGQSSGYSKISIQKYDEPRAYHTSYVSCNLCHGVFKNNGGHLGRHRKECKIHEEDLRDNEHPGATEITSKSDFDDAVIKYFTITAKPLYSLETQEFRELLVNFAKLGQKYRGDIDDSIVMKRGSSKALIDNTLTEKTEEIVDFVYKELGVSLTTPNLTRWMTSYTCASQVYEHLSKLIAQLNKFDDTIQDIIMDISSTDNRGLFEELDIIYKPLKECNAYFQKNSTVISEVLHVYLSLLDEVQEKCDHRLTTKNGRVLCKFALKAIKKQIDDLISAHYAAYYLNPAYKSIEILQGRLDDHQIAKNAKELVIHELERLDEELNKDSPLSPPPNAHSSSSSDSFITRRIKNVSYQPKSSLQSEMDLYHMDTMTSDPMYYWIESKKRFSRLYHIAEKLFSIPSSEADVERSFSQLKNVYAENRRSLDLAYIEKMMIVKQFEALDR
ncbi:hypothetical protein CAEBREN_14486 [Caenorhabditis brenneri]|uniref:HAT C-terminal dimerisation domain-containing protein n=1 Tax=Caenorhabditis brenneri TaxID=135651 RepID=G0PLN9_CAEBE|nr:hypothetical protein CAEBREN_14486 [Caenorhabditis brenneri]